MKLFLASSLDKTITLLGQKLGRPEKKRVLFVSNAADYSQGDKWWVRSDREAFEKIGYEINEADLREISKDDFFDQLKQSDIIHFCGGSVLYLISIIRDKKFDQIILDAVRNDGVIYSSTSAGSMIVSKDLSLSVFDPEEKQFAEKTKDHSGLGLVNFFIIPHIGNKDFIDGNKLMMEKVPQYNQALIFLYDNQVVWVEDEKFEILSI